MKRNVNLVLFGLVILSMVAMTAMAFYYKNTYDDLNERYQSSKADIMDAAGRLNKTISDVNAKEELLNQKERILNSYISELNLSKERETSLGAHFIDIKNYSMSLEDRLNKTTLDRNRWENLYNTTQRNYDILRVDYQLKKVESEERLNEIVRVRNLKPTLEANAEKLDDRNDELKTNAGRIDNNADEIKALADGIENTTLRDQIKSKADEIKLKVELIVDVLNELLENIAELKYTIGRI